ncbi:hypothetical protein M5689_008042 [Euphorbia peplus]|nr:hypothetical protein M5689_008042 [Euphorbia peplus]
MKNLPRTNKGRHHSSSPVKEQKQIWKQVDSSTREVPVQNVISRLQNDLRISKEIVSTKPTPNDNTNLNLLEGSAQEQFFEEFERNDSPGQQNIVHQTPIGQQIASNKDDTDDNYIELQNSFERLLDVVDDDNKSGSHTECEEEIVMETNQSQEQLKDPSPNLSWADQAEEEEKEGKDKNDGWRSVTKPPTKKSSSGKKKFAHNKRVRRVPNKLR